LLVGGGGEKKTLRTAARHADEWNIWSNPMCGAEARVLHRHCADIGRDPSEIAGVDSGLLFSSDEAWLKEKRDADPAAKPSSAPPRGRRDHGRYRDAGADEFIVPSGTSAPCPAARTPRPLPSTSSPHLQ